MNPVLLVISLHIAIGLEPFHVLLAPEHVTADWVEFEYMRAARSLTLKAKILMV
jgi:hypothetical protein